MSGSGATRFGGNEVVNIGGNRLPTRATTTTTTTRAPLPSPPPPPPPVFLIDTGSSIANRNSDDASSIVPNVKILRQEQEETADGYRYL